MTIRQLHTAQQITPDADDFMLNGQPLGQITIIAQVCKEYFLPHPTDEQILSSSPTAANLSYEVDDSTGTIDVRQWVDLGENSDYAPKKDEWNRGMYL